MPPEDDNDQLDDQDRDDQDIEGLGDKGKAALERERQARKEAKREARELNKQLVAAKAALGTERFARLKAQHEWLEEDDLKDIDLDAWEAKIERLAKIAGVAGQSASDTASDQAGAEAKAEVQRFTQQAGGQGPPANPGSEISALDADKKFRSGEWSQPQYETWMRQKYASKT